MYIKFYSLFEIFDSFPNFFLLSFLSFFHQSSFLSAPKTHKRKALDENSPYLERENRDKKW